MSMKFRGALFAACLLEEAKEHKGAVKKEIMMIGWLHCRRARQEKKFLRLTAGHGKDVMRIQRG